MRYRLLCVIFFMMSMAVSAVHAYPLTPFEPSSPGEFCRPGNPDYIERRYAEKIPYCFRNVASELKDQVYRNYKIPQHCRVFFTIDHLIPLSLGGNNEIRNLWPEHKRIKATRQGLEQKLYWDLRKGRVSHSDAVGRILAEKFHPPVGDAELASEPGDECQALDAS